MVRASERPWRHGQRGVTLFGLLFWAIVIGGVAYIGMQAFPTVNEYWTIQRAVNKIAAANPSTVAEARSAFERQKEVEYSIVSISGKDLEVTKENEKVVIAFSYSREVPLFGPVNLLMKYQGRSNVSTR